jgi:hypothetical protein
MFEKDVKLGDLLWHHYYLGQGKTERRLYLVRAKTRCLPCEKVAYRLDLFPCGNHTAVEVIVFEAHENFCIEPVEGK